MIRSTVWKMIAALLPSPFPSAPYVEGLRAGIAARDAAGCELPHLLEDAVTPGGRGEIDGNAPCESVNGALEESRFDVPTRLADCAMQDRAPDAEERLRFAEHGLVYLGPEKDGFAVQVYLPGGLLEPDQMRGLAAICQEFANGSVELDGQNRVSLQVVSVREAPEVLRRIEMVGLKTGKTPPYLAEGGLDELGSNMDNGELPVPHKRLLSGQMSALATLLEAGEGAGTLRLSAAGGLILSRRHLEDAAAIVAG